MAEHTGIEPVYSPRQGDVITIIRMLHDIESGAPSRNRTYVNRLEGGGPVR